MSDHGALPEGEPVFTATGVERSYPGVKALRGVDLTGYAGEVIAICGANGAGKSTFARLLAGLEQPNKGEIRVAGYDRPISTPADAERAGVLLMHQEPLIVDDFSVGENVWLYGLRSGRDVRPWGKPRKGFDLETRRALQEVGLGHLPSNAPAAPLGPGQRQMLALSRAVVNEHRLLILDETTASTTEAHFQDVVDMVAAERAKGVCVVFVSHRMDEVFTLSDRIAVFRNGELVDVKRTAETDREEITSLMIGAAVTAMHRPPASVRVEDPPQLRVSQLRSGPAHDISFDVKPGEILGIYGLVGSGRSSVARAITGQHKPQGGTVTVNGRQASLSSPRKALRSGLAYVTEDRRKEGFVPHFSNRENLTLVTMGGSSHGGVIRPAAERDRADELVRRFTVKGTRETLTATLSGGNQQKVCIAKWLAADPTVVVLDEPTKGIDVGARATIYDLIYQLAERGASVIVVSSEAEEILLLSHRLLVMRDGVIAAEMSADGTTTEDLIRAALGADMETSA
jgi:ABC-type sugar transport system ATPase subunit